jgi:phosphatidylcholine synthase
MTTQGTTFQRWRAFSVHLFTASGAFLAFLSLIAAAEGQWVAMFAWLGLALLVDGVDGPMARKVEIKRVLPDWSGDMLDAIIDYSTFCLIPAVALYLSDMIGKPWSFIAAALIVITSAIYYADTRMKTKDNFFRGFPVCWNMVVFAFFAIRPSEWAVFAIVVLCAAGTFAPVKFLHPVRVVRLRPLNLAMMVAWMAFGLAALLYGFDSPAWVRIGVALTSLYLISIGAIIQLLDRRAGSAASS